MSKEILIEKMNKLRQVKDVVYVNDKPQNCGFSTKEIANLVKGNPNDSDLGKEIRKIYFDSIKPNN
jgi:hypothetical protein